MVEADAAPLRVVGLGRPSGVVPSTEGVHCAQHHARQTLASLNSAAGYTGGAVYADPPVYAQGWRRLIANIVVGVRCARLHARRMPANQRHFAYAMVDRRYVPRTAPAPARSSSTARCMGEVASAKHHVKGLERKKTFAPIAAEARSAHHRARRTRANPNGDVCCTVPFVANHHVPGPGWKKNIVLIATEKRSVRRHASSTPDEPSSSASSTAAAASVLARAAAPASTSPEHSARPAAPAPTVGRGQRKSESPDAWRAGGMRELFPRSSGTDKTWT